MGGGARHRDRGGDDRRGAVRQRFGGLGTPARKVTPDRCLQAVAIKGFALPQGVADAVRSTVEIVGPILDQLAIDGLVTTSAGAFRPTEAGTARAAELQAADRAAMGADAATAALDDFLALDARMKETVTAWQLRDPAAQVLNDHTDAEYDRGVLDRLAALHADTVAWLAPLEPVVRPPRRLPRAPRRGEHPRPGR